MVLHVFEFISFHPHKPFQVPLSLFFMNDKIKTTFPLSMLFKQFFLFLSLFSFHLAFQSLSGFSWNCLGVMECFFTFKTLNCCCCCYCFNIMSKKSESHPNLVDCYPFLKSPISDSSKQSCPEFMTYEPVSLGNCLACKPLSDPSYVPQENVQTFHKSGSFSSKRFTLVSTFDDSIL